MALKFGLGVGLTCVGFATARAGLRTLAWGTRFGTNVAKTGSNASSASNQVLAAGAGAMFAGFSAVTGGALLMVSFVTGTGGLWLVGAHPYTHAVLGRVTERVWPAKERAPNDSTKTLSTRQKNPKEIN